MLPAGVNASAPIASAGPKNGPTVTTTRVQLNANNTVDFTGGALTYQWRFIPVFGQSATLLNGNTANPTAILPEGSVAEGTYTFELTVTNSLGQSSTDRVSIYYSPTSSTTTTPQQ